MSHTEGSDLAAADSSQDKPLESAQSNKGATNDIDDLHKWLEQSFAGFMVSDPMAHTRATIQMAADYAMKRIETIIRSEIAKETNKARLDELRRFITEPEPIEYYTKRKAQLTADKEQANAPKPHQP